MILEPLKRVLGTLKKAEFLEHFKRSKADRARTRFLRDAPNPTAIAAFDLKWLGMLRAQERRWDEEVFPACRDKFEQHKLKAMDPSTLLPPLVFACTGPQVDFYGHLEPAASESNGEGEDAYEAHESADACPADSLPGSDADDASGEEVHMSEDLEADDDEVLGSESESDEEPPPSWRPQQRNHKRPLHDHATGHTRFREPAAKAQRLY